MSDKQEKHPLKYEPFIDEPLPTGIDPNHVPRYKKKHPDDPSKGGRPTKWTEALAIELGEAWLKWLEEDESRAYANEFTAYKGIHEQRLYELTRKYPAFSEYHKKAQQIQKARLVKLALKGGNNQAGTIFILKNVAGMADKVETKSQNVNYNYDPKDLKTATEDDLQDIIRNASEREQAEA